MQSNWNKLPVGTIGRTGVTSMRLIVAAVVVVVVVVVAGVVVVGGGV